MNSFALGVLLRGKPMDAKDEHHLCVFVQCYNRIVRDHDVETKDTISENIKILCDLESCPLEQARAAWLSCKGKMGARDFWDAAHRTVRASMKKPRLQHQWLFNWCHALPHVVACVLGGNYGKGMQHALQHAYGTLCPALLVPDQAVGFQDLHVSATPLDDRLRSYLKHLFVRLQLSEASICAGVLNHFVEAYDDIPNTHKCTTCSEQDVLRVMKANAREASQYLDNCLGDVNIDVVMEDTMSQVHMKVSHRKGSSDMKAFLKGAVEQVQSDDHMDTLQRLAKTLAYAEYTWEHAERTI